MFCKLADQKLHLNSLSNRPKRKKQPSARFCDPEQIAKKSTVEASVITKDHFSKEHHCKEEEKSIRNKLLTSVPKKSIPSAVVIH